MSPSGTDGCQSVVTFWHHYNFKYSSRQAVFLGFEILKWSDSFKEKMCQKKREREREKERERKTVAFLSFFFSPPPFFYGVDNLWMLFGNKTQSQRSLSDEVFGTGRLFPPSLFLYLMITLNGLAPHGTARAAQFCSPLISAFEAQGSEAVAKQTPHQAGSKIRQSSLP